MTSEQVTNPEVFVWALYDLDGANQFVDVEEIFLRAFEIAPLRFAWRTRPEIPDLKRCSKALQEAEAWSPKLFVKKGPEMRKLTVEGQQWIEENFDRLADVLGSDAVVRAPRLRLPSRLIAQALQSSLYTDWQLNKRIGDDLWKVAEMLRCSPDSSRHVFADRLETLRSAAYSAGRLDVLEFFDAVLAQHSDWF
ncbi:MAG: hypothetical protein ABSE82_12240 [Nitrososphaerales archaeon]|jgi:hypothetical protein